MHLCVYVHPSNLTPARAKARVSKSYIYVYVYICMYSMRGRLSVHPSIICPNPMEAKIITHLRSADKVFVRFSGRLGLFWLTARRLYISVESHRIAKSTLSNAQQHTATHSNILQLTATHSNTLPLTLQYTDFTYLLNHTGLPSQHKQLTATHRNTLQHTATHCNSQQHTAIH